MSKLADLANNAVTALRNYEVHSAAFKSYNAISQASYKSLEKAYDAYGAAKKELDDYKAEAGL
jgi:hypothetical protein